MILLLIVFNLLTIFLTSIMKQSNKQYFQLIVSYLYPQDWFNKVVLYCLKFKPFIQCLTLFQIKSGTFNRFIELLTDNNRFMELMTDSQKNRIDFVKVFLLTYQVIVNILHKVR